MPRNAAYHPCVPRGRLSIPILVVGVGLVVLAGDRTWLRFCAFAGTFIALLADGWWRWSHGEPTSSRDGGRLLPRKPASAVANPEKPVAATPRPDAAAGTPAVFRAQVQRRNPDGTGLWLPWPFGKLTFTPTSAEIHTLSDASDISRSQVVEVVALAPRSLFGRSTQYTFLLTDGSFAPVSFASPRLLGASRLRATMLQMGWGEAHRSVTQSDWIRAQRQ